MAERRDIEEIKLTASDLLDVDLKDEDLKALDLGDDLSGDDILDDDFSDPVQRPRKKRQAMSMTMLVLMLALTIVGGGFILLNNESLTRAITASAPVPKELLPVDKPVLTDAGAGETPVSSAPVAESTPVTTVTGFDDLPQPSAIQTDNSSVAPAPSAQMVPPSGAADPNLPPPVAENVMEPEFVDISKKPEAVKSDEVVPAKEMSAAAVKTEEPKADLSTVETPVVPSADVPPSTIEIPAQVDGVTAPSVTIPIQPAVKSQQSAQKLIESKPEASSARVLEKTEEVIPPVPPVASDDVDEYAEEKALVEKMSKSTEPRFTVPIGQEDRDLGISVDNSGMNSGDEVGATIEARISSASRALDLERYQAAFDMFDALYKTNKRDERVLMGRAVALQKLGRNEEAIKAYDELLALNPESPEVMTNMLGLVRQQYPSAALERLLELRQRYPNNPVVAAQAGLANAGVGNFEEGLRYLGIAAGLEPNNPKHPFNMAVIAERMGKADLAITYYERALKADAMTTDTQKKVNRDLIYDRLSLLRQR